MIVAVSVLQLNLTIQRRSRAHVENSPPPEKLNSNKKSLARNIFILKTTKRKAVPLSSKRGTPPFKICYISKSFAPCEATGIWELASGIFTIGNAVPKFATCHFQFAILLASGIFIIAVANHLFNR